MKKVFLSLVALALVTVSFTSCRDEEKTEKEELIEEMEDAGAEVKKKVESDGDVKIKMETEDKEVKIKEDADGDVKIKVDNN